MRKYTHITIVNEADLDSMITLFECDKASILAGAFDTETTGLHHIYDVPFLYQFGWATADHGYTFAVDLELNTAMARRTITIWHYYAAQLAIYLGHNIKYDLHMETNIGIPYNVNNVSDTMIWIRLASDAIPTRSGGVNLKLKNFASKYVDRSAKDMDSKLQLERTSIASVLNRKLKTRLGWTKKQIDDFFNDKIHTKEDLPDELQQAYQDWLDFDVPGWLRNRVHGAVDADQIRYDKLNRENVTYYGHLDIVWTLETYFVCEPIVRARGNTKALEYEHGNIYPLYKMERNGFKINFEYLLKAQRDMKAYIQIRRKDLITLAGQPIKSSQAIAVIQVLKDMGVDCTSTNADILSRICSDLKKENKNPDAVDFIETLQELRTLEKWYSTYICRFVDNFNVADGKLYTTINQVGTVSGRVTSDFQQFPKDGIITLDGIELFHPRKMVIADDDEYYAIVYLDYSQIELRLQAMYTILVGHPDLNLCRAYMPYKCFTIKEDGTNIPYKYDDDWCKSHAYDIDWYYDETPTEKWTATDVHGATTKAAFGIDEHDPQYHKLRYIGKRVNFAKNYGAQRGKIEEMFPEFDAVTITRIDNAYYIAFPGVKEYHSYCYKMASKNAYMQNLFGVRYYGASGHNLINMLIQGTGAYFLKWKIMQVNEYLVRIGAKSKIIMQIHDELQIKMHPDDDASIFFEIKRIMEEWKDTLVPIVADMEITYTTWEAKYEISQESDINEVKEIVRKRNLCSRN